MAEKICGARTACALSLLLAASMSYAGESSFETGRFLSGDREVYSGLFVEDVTIETITIGAATFRASLDELIEPLTVRVRIDRIGNGKFELLSDEMLRSGAFPVGFAVALGLDPDDYSTALDAMQGLSLGHMLFTDGSAAVQIDVLLIASLVDDRPTEDDMTPELVLLGSLGSHGVTAQAIIGGNVDEPIFAKAPTDFTNQAFAIGTTGVDMVTHQMARPLPVAMVGMDLSSDLGVAEETRVYGYRITISPGAPAMFNILGAGMDSQRALAQDLPIVPNIDDFMLGDFGGAFGGAGGGAFRIPGVAETSQFLARVPLDFQGTGGGGGGGGDNFPPPPPPEPPPDPEVPAPATLPALLLLFVRGSRRRRS